MKKSSKNHWENIYKSKSVSEVSWYSPHLRKSIQLITEAAIPKEAKIIDIGSGASTLTNDLVKKGYHQLTVLDISSQAIQYLKEHLKDSPTITYIQGDILKVDLEKDSFDIWHDRALFHFLTLQKNRNKYISLINRCLKPGGKLVIATFGPAGPTSCSGLDVVRYSPQILNQELGKNFTLLKSLTDKHKTPMGKTQQFIYCLFRKDM